MTSVGPHGGGGPDLNAAAVLALMAGADPDAMTDLQTVAHGLKMVTINQTLLSAQWADARRRGEAGEYFRGRVAAQAD